MTRQLSLFDRPTMVTAYMEGMRVHDAPRNGHGALEHYGPWPAPDGWYSHFVVWRTCLAWELRAWLTARGGAA